MGASHLTMFCCKIYPHGFAPNGLDFEVLSSQCDRNCGVASIDALLFELMRKKAQEKLPNSNNLAEAGSKAGARLLRGVDRLRKLLGTMPTAEVTVENIAEDCDVRISVSRSELAEISAPIIDKIKKMVAEVIEASGVVPTEFSSVEILGGGTRIPMVQEAIMEVMQNNNLVFGQKLDSSAIAYGSALLMKSYLSHSSKETATDNTSKGVSGDDSAAPAEEGGSDESAKKEGEAGTIEQAVEQSPAAVSPNDISFEFLTISDDSGVEGITEQDLTQMAEAEVKMFEADEVLALISAQKNEIESFILTMRSAPHQKHGGSINVSELEKLLNEAEDWSYSDEAYSADAATVTAKLTTLKREVEALCSEYFAAVQNEKDLKEKEMEEEARKAEQEKFESGEDDDKAEKDNRRLTKAERMKKVMKHKETGTELFKGKNFVHATKHYKDALTHCTKFFDLSAADEEEVKAVKLTLYLNLATCWTKLDNLDQVFKCCSDALMLDPNSPKALYRRAMVYEKRKDFEKAKKDLLLANKQPGSEGDSAIATLLKRVEIQMKKEKEKEKKMYGKMFS
jgi:molecular chaperone DnaK (HSP70)